MKTKLLTLASLLAFLNAKAVEIGPTGSGIEFGGFVDWSYQSQDTKDGSDDDAFDATQVELNLDFADGPFSVSVDYDIYSTEGAMNKDGQDGADLEEAIITYDFGNGFSMTAGKMLTYMGFEAYDPPNMYQYSYAYDINSGEDPDTGANVHNVGGQQIYDAYDDGITLDYGSDMFSFGVFASAETDGGFEYALAFTGIDNLTVKYILADWDDYEKYTFWASYQMDKLLLAFEVAEADFTDEATDDVDGFLVMGNYAISDPLALTVRYSETTVGLAEFEKFTISPSYVFTDSVAGLIEYSTYDVEDAYNEINDLFAVELIFTF
jgi:hypothetical protein